MTLSEAKNALTSKNLNYIYSGSGKVVSQNIAEDVTIEQGTVVTIRLQ